MPIVACEHSCMCQQAASFADIWGVICMQHNWSAVCVGLDAMHVQAA
jgi:hypothetical protein